jgi:hypothetical protein
MLKQERITHLTKIGFGTLLLSLLIIAMAQASQVSLQWDPNNPSPEGYKLFIRNADQSYDYDQPIWQGSATTATVDCDSGEGCYFVVRAFDSNANESGDSNEVYYEVASADPDPDNDYGNPPVDSPDSEDTPPGSIGENPTDGFDMDERADLTPLLEADTAVLNQIKGHAKTRWQISTDSGFSALVLDITSSNLTSYQVPDLILDTDEEYFWRALFLDDQGDIIFVGDFQRFTTIEASQSDDLDSNGLPDSQEPNHEILDLDNNGVNDYIQGDILCVNNVNGDGQIGIKTVSPHATLVSLMSHNNYSFSNSLNVPEMTSMGIISFKLHLVNDETTATVTVYFSTPAPDDAHWFKYDTELGWQEYDEAVFSDDRLSVTITLVDGGAGDEDGIRNGIIVDPSGLGYRSSGSQNMGSAGSAAGPANSCFISSIDQARGFRTCPMVLVFTVALVMLGRFLRTGRESRQ